MATVQYIISHISAQIKHHLSDGWSSYILPHEHGFEHCTVQHKYVYKATYKNALAEEKIEVHTDRIEGAWKHVKEIICCFIYPFTHPRFRTH